MVASLAIYTNDILQITNLLNKSHIYTIDKEGVSQTLRNDENFTFALKDAVKYHRYKNLNLPQHQ